MTRAPRTDVQTSSRSGDYGKQRGREVDRREQQRRVRASHRSERASERPDAREVVRAVEETIARRQRTKADRNILERLTSSSPSATAPFLTPRQIRFDDDRDGILNSGEQKALLGRQSTTQTLAPALKVLNETLRPIRGVAAGADAAISGRNPLTAAAKGVTTNKGPLFGDVLRKAGLPNGVASVAGFGLDVGLDPTTYLTGGTAAVGRKAAVRELARIEKKAAAAGMSEAGQRTVVRAASKRLAENDARGVVVKLGGVEIPGVTRATAAAGKAAKKAAGKAPQAVRSTAAGSRDIVREVHPQLKPAGANRAEFEGARRAARQSRAAENQAVGRAQRQALALRKKIGEENYADVINAIEKGTVHKLPANLKEPGQYLRSSFRHALRTRRQAGVAHGKLNDYFPHARTDLLDEGGEIVDAPRSGGASVKQVSSARARTDRRTVREINADPKAATLSEDIPAVFANYAAQTSHIVNQTRFLKQLADAGRPFKGTAAPAKNDVVLHFADRDGRYGVRQVPAREVEEVLAGSPRKSGRYVVMNAQTFKEAVRGAERRVAGSKAGEVFDRGSGTWKRVATMTPGFHIRNVIGDAQMAYLSQPARKLPGNVRQAGRALRVVGKDERTPLDLSSAAEGKTIKIRGRQVPMKDFLRHAERNGVIRSGYIGRELEDLSNGGKVRTPTPGAGAVRRAGRAVKDSRPIQGGKRQMQNREDIFRLATYKNALDDGLTPGEAADRALKTHIDYGDVSDLERRILRRAFPFYTFSARAIPLHASKLATNPGKFANFAKVREEGARASGYESASDADRDMPEYAQRQVPVVLPFGKTGRGVSAALPFNTLNEIPVGMNPATYASELSKYGISMLNPAPQKIIELQANRSFFNRRDIENAEAPLVAAPAWVKGLPKASREKLGVVTDYIDKRTGKRVVAWPGKVDYAFKSLPGPFYLANQAATSGTSRRGQSQGEVLASSISGVKFDRLDPVSNAISLLYERQSKLLQDQASDNQRGISASSGRVTPAYVKRAQEIRQVKQKLTVLTSERGDAVPYGGSRADVSAQGAADTPARARALRRAERAKSRAQGSDAARKRAVRRAERAAQRRR